MPASEVKRKLSAENAENTFYPLAALTNAIRFWWFVFLCMVVGGLVGWIWNQSQPPVYEAVARFSASIDFVSTGPLTQYEEDVAFNAIGDLIYSTETVQKVVEQAEAQGITISIRLLRANAVLERKLNTWDLRVRDKDPQKAEMLANLWVEQGQADLFEAYQHAIQAEHLNRYLRSLENCLAQAGTSQQVSVMCNPSRFGEIQESIHNAGEKLFQERKASRRIFSGLTIAPADQAVVSDKPVIFARNQMVLGGCLIGFFLGIWLVQLGIPARWLRRD